MAENGSAKYDVHAQISRTHYHVSKLLILGLIFHVVYLRSVFDCYFTSPVVNGMKSYGTVSSGGKAPAKRLVLIVGDGLRADLLFNLNAFSGIEDSPEIVAPYLRSIATRRGAFGISHTRVPTESRPGHVAIIGGMYEDVSAVTKGWKTNPVDFDSVFNQSSTTFSFGSPDILPMFAKGAIPGRVKTWCYDEDEEDFTKDATALDVWSFSHLKTLFKNATKDQQLMSELHKDKVVFFLHLLGLDTTGHSYRPHSKEYMENIRVVDNIVYQTEKLFESFYGDHETAFIFTADHGMSEIGNHGDGHPDNTRTPILAWGSGIRGPLPDISLSSHDDYSKPWGLGHLYRRDLDQADIAPLMATLIGIDWPVNSVGVLPDVDPSRPGFLDVDNGSIASASIINAKVILEQYRIKHELKKRHTFFYRPFSALAGVSSTDDSPQVTIIEALLMAKQWSSVRNASLELIRHSLDGLHYLQTYDRFLIKGLVTAAYTGWVAFASLYILRPQDNTPNTYFSTSTLTLVIRISSWAILLTFWALFVMQRSPLMFYVYITFPCYFWQCFLVQIIPFMHYYSQGVTISDHFVRILFKGGVVVGTLLGMVAAYTHRSIWSIGFVLIGVLWPLTWNRHQLSQNCGIISLWMVSCLVTAIFPLLSVNKNESLSTIVLGGSVMLLAVLAGLIETLRTSKQLFRLFFIQGKSLFILFAMIVTVLSVKSLQAKQGLPLLNQITGWTVLVVSTAFPFFARCDAHIKFTKILMYFFGFCPLFIILSISVEGLFFVSYSVTLLTWVKVECVVHPERDFKKKEHLAGKEIKESEVALSRSWVYSFQPDDLRIALFFLFFVQVGFFGTGNFASISSFYLAPVYRLIPIFNPFYMSTLLVLKIIAPYIMLSVIFADLNDALHLPPFSLLLVALTLTDGMTLMFFYMVQDTGSWLEIGQSITFFCVSSLLLLWSAGICVAGEYLMADVILSKKLVTQH